MPNDFIEIFNNLLMMLPIMIFSLSVHEASHAYAALYYGDRTAHQLGRITLNPVAHVDIVGTLIIPILGIFTLGFSPIGWAKPVPVNVYNLRDPRRAYCMIALAGPLSNIALSVMFLLILIFLMVLIALTNTDFGTANSFIFNLLQRGILLNIALAVFNMIPIPPLDGSKVVSYFLPERAAESYLSIERYGFIIILVLINIPILRSLLSNVIFALYEPYLQLAGLVLGTVV